MVELRDMGLVEQWAYCGANLESRSGSVPIYRWLHATATEVPALPPPAFVCALGLLLEGEPLKSHNADGMPDALRGAIRRCEDNLLGRLAADPKLRRVQAAVAGHQNTGRALAYLTGAILERIGFEAGVEVPPGMLRHLGDDERVDADPYICSLLEAGYADLSAKAVECTELITTGDVVVLQNLDVLGDLAQRLSARHAISAAEHLRQFAPDGLAFLRSDGNTPIAVTDEDTYPIGGFASMTTSGPIENLVSSELVYMDTKRNGSIDLFDMRMAEGELLYYTRDEALLVRRRRELFLFMPEDMTPARVRDDLGTQKTNVLLGLVRVVVERLVAVLGDEDLRVHIVWPLTSRVEDEFQLCRILMSSWIKQGIVEVSRSADRRTLSHLEQKATVRTFQLVLESGSGSAGTLSTQRDKTVVGLLSKPWEQLVPMIVEHLWSS